MKGYLAALEFTVLAVTALAGWVSYMVTSEHLAGTGWEYIIPVFVTIILYLVIRGTWWEVARRRAMISEQSPNTSVGSGTSNMTCVSFRSGEHEHVIFHEDFLGLDRVEACRGVTK